MLHGIQQASSCFRNPNKSRSKAEHRVLSRRLVGKVEQVPRKVVPVGLHPARVAHAVRCRFRSVATRLATVATLFRGALRQRGETVIADSLPLLLCEQTKVRLQFVFLGETLVFGGRRTSCESHRLTTDD